MVACSQILYIVHDWGHRVVVPARRATQADTLVRQPYAGVNYISQSGTMNLATEYASCKVEGLGGGGEAIRLQQSSGRLFQYIFFTIIADDIGFDSN